MINLAKLLDNNQWNCMEVFNNEKGFSLWHTIAMEWGSKSHLNYDLFINLDCSFDQIKSNFRKSYKSLINSG